jgi:hypothetical protein
MNELPAMLAAISSGGASRRRRDPREAARLSIRAPDFSKFAKWGQPGA